MKSSKLVLESYQWLLEVSRSKGFSERLQDNDSFDSYVDAFIQFLDRDNGTRRWKSEIEKGNMFYFISALFLAGGWKNYWEGRDDALDQEGESWKRE